jgi:hypothetical protein
LEEGGEQGENEKDEGEQIYASHTPGGVPGGGKRRMRSESLAGQRPVVQRGSGGDVKARADTAITGPIRGDFEEVRGY